MTSPTVAVRALGAAQHLDALHPARAGIVGDVEIGLHLDHGATPACALRAARASRRPARRSTIQRLRFEIGRHSSMRTCVAGLVGIGLVMRGVLLRARDELLVDRVHDAALDADDRRSCRPCRSPPPLAGLASASSRLSSRTPCAARSPRMVLMRAMSRRTCRTRAVFSSWPVAFWKRRLNSSFSSLLQLGRPARRRSWPGRPRPSLLRPPRRARVTTRVLIGSLAAASSNASRASVGRHAVELEHDAARLHPADPEFRRALAAAHAHFGRLLRHRHVREDADPDAADASCGA